MTSTNNTGDIAQSGGVVLYQALIDAWNRKDAHGFSACFADVANAIGFDGSQMDGRANIESSLAGIFRDHKTARYVTIVRDVRALSDGVILLRAVAGMVPEGGTTINAAVNAIQSMIAHLEGSLWKIVLFQNTPAAFHGRPEMAQALTRELQSAFDAKP